MEASSHETIDVRPALCGSQEFGPSDVALIQDAVFGRNGNDVKQCLHELEEKLSSGQGSPRDRLAFGVGSYFLAWHENAERALSELNGDGLAVFYRAKALMSLERFAEAADAFQQAADAGFDPVLSVLFRAGALRLAGRLDDAEALLRSKSREGATLAEYSYQMACLLADQGDTFGAIEYFERAVDMEPDHSGALFRLAGLNYLLENDDEAIQLYEQSLSKPPLFLGALINLGLLYEDQGNNNAAEYCFRRVLETHPNHQRARLYLKDIEAAGDMYYDEDAARRQRELEQVTQLAITDFELSARSRNCLEDAGIFTLGDLMEISEQELLAKKNFGATSLTELKEIMDSKGLKIGQSIHAAKPSPPSYVPEDLSPEEQAAVGRPVTDLNLSVRSRKCLTRLGITEIGELISKSADELMSVRNFGVTSLNEIRARLSDHGLKLRND